MRNVVATVLTVVLATFAPAAFADVYVWCYVQVGLTPKTWYYSDASFADIGDKNLLEGDFLAHVTATYGGNVTGSNCRWRNSRGEAMRDRDSYLAKMRESGTSTVNTRWTWPGL